MQCKISYLYAFLYVCIYYLYNSFGYVNVLLVIKILLAIGFLI